MKNIIANTLSCKSANITFQWLSSPSADKIPRNLQKIDQQCLVYLEKQSPQYEKWGIIVYFHHVSYGIVPDDEWTVSIIIP